MNTQIPIIAIASTLVACSDNAAERDLTQPQDEPIQSSIGPDSGKLDRVFPRQPDNKTTGASAVLVATTKGDLCVLDPTSGEVVDIEPSTAIDVFTSRLTPSRAVASAWAEDGGGTLLEYDVSVEGLTLRAEESLPFEDTRLLHGPNPTVALGTNEGTTLFAGGEGRAIFGTSSFLVQQDEPGLDIFLLEHATKDPQLLHLRWESGLREVARTPTLTPSLSCAPRLVRDGPEPLLIGVNDGELFVLAADGTKRGRLPHAAEPDACVEDALWLEGTGDIAVVTGPDIRVHLLGTDGEHEGESLVMAGQLGHDPRPHRRLAYDSARARLWIALSERLEMRHHTASGRFERDVVWEQGCDAESVTLVWNE